MGRCARGGAAPKGVYGGSGSGALSSQLIACHHAVNNSRIPPQLQQGMGGAWRGMSEVRFASKDSAKGDGVPYDVASSQGPFVSYVKARGRCHVWRCPFVGQLFPTDSSTRQFQKKNHKTLHVVTRPIVGAHQF